jgi:adenosylmethionine---8-amino-7-oxononanoate aminotransferase
MHPLAKLDLAYHWHPFTQMRDWLKQEPIVIVSGHGATLRDVHGRSYLDANASIWTNLHGHRNPHIDRALRRQLNKIAHCSALGLANEPAARLAAQLVNLANPPFLPAGTPTTPLLEKVFFSDDGSTGIEVALKMTAEFSRRTGRTRTPRFLSLTGAYHGDTIGAVSLGHINLFHRAYSDLLFKSDAAMAPYCYRCPYNRAKPQRADARLYRQCHWECVDEVEQHFNRAKRQRRPYSAFVVEPGIQGAAGMIPHPDGWLLRVATIARSHRTPLIADEIMTGFGRTTPPASISQPSTQSLPPSRANLPLLFASHTQDVQPDFMVLAKGLTGGYLPMAATLTTREIFDAFLGEYSDFKTFFHGHSYTANPLAAAAALASLDLLSRPASRIRRARIDLALRNELASLWSLPNVGDVRQVGLVAAVELVKHWPTREPFDLREQAGIRVCNAMSRRGVLTRPIGNVVVLMPPYCTTPRQIRQAVSALHDSIAETFPAAPPV